MLPEEAVKALRKDRRNGGMSDPAANIHHEEFHEYLRGLSKAELTDLALEFFFEDYGRFEVNKRYSMRERLDMLRHEVEVMLNARYCNRHPEEI